MKPHDNASINRLADSDLDGLLRPAQVFDHPRDVVADTCLDLDEKRVILASWASDACAVEAAPALRLPLGGRRAVSIDEILEALCDLDKEAREITLEAAPIDGAAAGVEGKRRRSESSRRISH